MVVLLAAYAAYSVARSAERIEAATTAQVTERALTDVSDPLAALCASDPTVRARLGPACLTASQVAAAPPGRPTAGLPGRAGERGAQGQTGDRGQDGRGIVSTEVTEQGRFVITYSDGTVTDLGPIFGPDGVGIAELSILDQRLVVALSDGRVIDLGRIVGERGLPGQTGQDGQAGRGVAATSIVEGRLVITYDDGTVEDAGALPRAELPATYTRTFDDGTAETCTRQGGEDTGPVYACTDRA